MGSTCPVCKASYKRLDTHLRQSVYCSEHLYASRQRLTETSQEQVMKDSIETETAGPIGISSTEHARLNDPFLRLVVEKVTTDPSLVLSRLDTVLQQQHLLGKHIATIGETTTRQQVLQNQPTTDSLEQSPAHNDDADGNDGGVLRPVYPDDDTYLTVDILLDPAQQDVATHAANQCSIIPSADAIRDSECNVTFSRQERFSSSLLDVLDFANTPLYLYDEILKVIQHHARSGLDIATTPIPNRKSFLRTTSERFRCPKPSSEMVGLEKPTKSNDDVTSTLPHPMDRMSAPVITYDFREQIVDLLSSKSLFADMANFTGTVDPEDPFSCRSPRKDGQIDEVVDGLWYEYTYNDIAQRHNDPVPFFIIPIIIYLDKTGTDVYQRYPLEPVLFTTALLNRKARNNPSAWRPLGFIPDIQQSSVASKTAERGSQLGKGRPTRNYHKCLRRLLRSFGESQSRNGGMYGHLRIGNQVRFVSMYFPLAFVMGDALSGDKLCGRYAGYGQISRISRCCYTSFDDADNVHMECQFAQASHFSVASRIYLADKGIVSEDHEQVNDPTRGHGDPVVEQGFDGVRTSRQARAYLHNASQHAHFNAFENIWFGSNPYGINGATPNDLMHIFLLGIVPYSLEVYFSMFTASEKAKLDDYIDRAHRTHRTSESGNYPRSSFGKGVTNLTLLTADEWIGVTFCMALLAISYDGRKLLDEVTMRNASENTAQSDNDSDIDCDLFAKVARQQNPVFENREMAIRASLLPATTGRHRKRHNEADNIPIVSSQTAPASVVGENNPRSPREHPPDGPSITCDTHQFLYIMETILCFHAWYKRGYPYNLRNADVMTNVKYAISKFLSVIKTKLPRQDGNGWKIQKFHEMLHVPRDILVFGSPGNYDAGPGEHMLIHFAKDSAKNAQKREATFLDQVNSRLYEKALLGKVTQHLPADCRQSIRYDKLSKKQAGSYIDHVQEKRYKTTAISSELQGNAKYIFRVSCPTIPNLSEIPWYEHEAISLQYEWQSGAVATKGHRNVHPVIFNWFQEKMEDRDITIYGDVGVVEYKRDGVMFRAHPNYSSEGPWYDWVAARFVYGEEPTNRPRQQQEPEIKKGFLDDDLYPSKILCFFKKSDCDETFALLHSCFPNQHSEDSVIIERWQMEYKASHIGKGRERQKIHRPVIHCVDVDIFGPRLFVREDDATIHEWITHDRYRGQHGYPFVSVVTPSGEGWAAKFA